MGTWAESVHCPEPGLNIIDLPAGLFSSFVFLSNTS